ncbi:MAG: HAD family phosphatase [Muribaculum sp.]|nr:HAD family phosphatase [Muribaculum sp.]
MTDEHSCAIERLRAQLQHTRAALIDMDGVLYDSMKYHTLAWQRTMAELGLVCTRDEFYLYEGMTGAATISLIFNRSLGYTPDAERIRRIYARKSRHFVEQGRKETMPGADRMLQALRHAGIDRVLVTGSSQQSILDSLSADYPGAFAQGMRITAADVVRGKPDPEPYLRAMKLVDADARHCIVIENAPLGVRAGKAAGAFTIAVATGPIPREAFVKEGADIIFGSMPEFADTLEKILTAAKR